MFEVFALPTGIQPIEQQALRDSEWVDEHSFYPSDVGLAELFQRLASGLFGILRK